MQAPPVSVGRHATHVSWFQRSHKRSGSVAAPRCHACLHGAIWCAHCALHSDPIRPKLCVLRAHVLRKPDVGSALAKPALSKRTSLDWRLELRLQVGESRLAAGGDRQCWTCRQTSQHGKPCRLSAAFRSQVTSPHTDNLSWSADEVSCVLCWRAARFPQTHTPCGS